MRMPAYISIYALPGMFRKSVDHVGMKHTKDIYGPFFRDVSDLGVKDFEVFPYSHDEDKQYPYAPYKRDWTWDKEWWRVYRAFLTTAKKNGCRIEPVLWSKYQWRMYERDGMHPLSDTAYSYARPYFLKLGRTHKRKFPVGTRRVRYSNEIQHAGNHDRGIDWTLWHEQVFDDTRHLWKLKNLKCDVSHSDFMKLEEEHYRVASLSSSGEYKLISKAKYDNTGPEFKREWLIVRSWGREEFDRTVWIEWHGASHHKMTGPVEPGADKSYIQIMHQGSWNNFVWNLDGVSDFSGGNVPGTGWTKPTYSDIRNWSKLGFRQNFGGVRVLLGYFPMEIFRRNAEGQLVEDLSLFDLNFIKIIKQEFESWRGSNA